MKKNILLVMFLLLTILAFFIVQTEKNQNKISIREVYDEDINALKWHLDLFTSDLELNYNGEGETLKFYFEVWEKGKIIDEIGGISKRGIEGRVNEDISISARLIDENQYKLKLGVGAVSSEAIFNKGNEYFYNHIPLEESINISKDVEYVLWGLSGSRIGEPVLFGASNEETLKSGSRSLVLKVKIE